jgi:hypothetical protein
MVPSEGYDLTPGIGDVFLTVMTARKTKSRKKSMTLEDFALLIQKDLARMATKEDLEGLATKRELAEIREEMATKKDLQAIREEMATKEDLSAVSDRISVAKDELQEQISGLKYAKEIDELRARVNTLEHKVGIRPARRAA